MLLLIFSTLLPSIGRAQQPGGPAGGRPAPELEVREDPSRKARTQSAAEAAAGAPKGAKEDEADVTYEQVLADPDNVELNVRYARSQIIRGDLKGASATLERVVLVNPNLHRERLLYAVVLFRLDSMTESERELNTLIGASAPDAVKAEAEDFLKQIRRRRRRGHIDLTLGVGYDWDSNRTATPATEELLLTDRFIKLNPANPETQDTAIVGLGIFKLTRDLGDQRGHEAWGSFNWYRAEQTKQDHLDLSVYSLQTGLVMKFSPWQLLPGVTWDHIKLSEEQFLQRSSIGMRVERRMTDRLSSNMEGRAAYDVYSRTSDVPIAQERDGRQVDWVWGLDYAVSPRQKVSGSYGYISKGVGENRRKYNSYDRHAFTAGHMALLGRGMFFITALTFHIDQYDKSDPLIGLKVRDDLTYRARLTYGTPLGFIHKYFKDFLFTQTYEYYRSESNITNYLHDNNKFSSLLTYHWGW